MFTMEIFLGEGVEGGIEGFLYCEKLIALFTR